MNEHDDGEIKQTLEQVKKLATLALDGGDPSSEEARTAAVKALSLIREHKLMVVPAAALEHATKSVEGMRREIDRVRADASKDATTKMVMGALGGLVLSKFIKI